MSVVFESFDEPDFALTEEDLSPEADVLLLAALDEEDKEAAPEEVLWPDSPEPVVGPDPVVEEGLALSVLLPVIFESVFEVKVPCPELLLCSVDEELRFWFFSLSFIVLISSVFGL